MSTTPPEPYPASPAPGAYPPPAAPVAPVAGPRPRGPRTLGVIAFLAAVIAVVGGSILTYVGGSLAAVLARYAETSSTGSTSIDTSTLPADVQAQFATGGVLVVAGFAVAGVFALWALIQGIVAAAKNRGRGWGIGAIVVAVLSFLPVSIFLGLGAAAGAVSALN